MRDLHVERLHFKIGSGEGIAYHNPSPLSFSNALGKFETRGQALTVEPADHFASEDEARAVLDPYLRSWEIEADLVFDVGAIRFTFDRSEIVDRNPPPPGQHRLIAGTAKFSFTGMDAVLTVVTRAFLRTPLVSASRSCCVRCCAGCNRLSGSPVARGLPP